VSKREGFMRLKPGKCLFFLLPINPISFTVEAQKPFFCKKKINLLPMAALTAVASMTSMAALAVMADRENGSNGINGSSSTIGSEGSNGR